MKVFVGLIRSWKSVYPMAIAMSSIRKTVANLLKTAQAAMWLCIAMMLVVFPAQRAHQVTEHLRAPEIRRSIERNVFLEQSTSDVKEQIEASNLEPLGFVPEDKEIAKPLLAETLSSIYSDRALSLARLLHRLKLGRSLSNAPDPLI